MKKFLCPLIFLLFLGVMACGKPFEPNFPYDYSISEGEYTLYARCQDTADSPCSFEFRLLCGSQEVAEPLFLDFEPNGGYPENFNELRSRWAMKELDGTPTIQFALSGRTADVTAGTYRLHMDFDSREMEYHQEFDAENFSEDSTSPDGVYTAGTYNMPRDGLYLVIRHNETGQYTCLDEVGAGFQLFWGEDSTLCLLSYQGLLAYDAKSGQKTDQPFPVHWCVNEETHYVSAAYDEVLERYFLLFRESDRGFLSLNIYSLDGKLLETRPTDIPEPECRPFSYLMWPVMQAHAGTVYINWQQPIARTYLYQ